MIVNHAGGNSWQFTESLKVWSSTSFAPSVKIRPIVVTASVTSAVAEFKIEFDFVEGANLWLPFQLEMVAPEKTSGKAEFYNLEGYKILDISSPGVKSLWELTAQGSFMRVGMKSPEACTVDFQILRQADV